MNRSGGRPPFRESTAGVSVLGSKKSLFINLSLEEVFLSFNLSIQFLFLKTIEIVIRLRTVFFLVEVLKIWAFLR